MKKFHAIIDIVRALFLMVSGAGIFYLLNRKFDLVKKADEKVDHLKKKLREEVDSIELEDGDIEK